MDTNPNSMIKNLLDELQNGADTQRRAAAYKLGKLGDPAAIPGLSEALSDADDSVRQNAATALREIETRKTALENTNKTPPPAFLERALAALSHLSFFLIMLLPLLDYLSRPLAEVFAYIFIFSPPLYGLIIGIVFKRRSPFTASHALQAALAHPVFPIVYIIVFYMVDADNNMSAGTGMAFCLSPFFMVWLLMFFIGTLQAVLGKDFTYPLIGKTIKETFLKNTKPG